MEQTCDAWKVLGKNLCRARLLYAVSQRDMAAYIGVNPALLSRVESGREKPSERVIKAYAERFRMQLDELTTLAGSAT